MGNARLGVSRELSAIWAEAALRVVLRVKETDRIAAMAANLRLIGAGRRNSQGRVCARAR